MGQRTQILVIRENNKGEKNVKFYHHQWGFGRVMYLALMDAYMNDYNKESFKSGYNFLNNKDFTTNDKIHDVTTDVPKEVLNAVDITDFETIKNVFEFGDNNNGGLVISIKEGNKHYDGADFKIGFLLGKEDSYTYDNKTNEQIDIEKPFSRYLTPQEYGKMNGGCSYSDEKFVKMFTDFCEYFGIEYLSNVNE